MNRLRVFLAIVICFTYIGLLLQGSVRGEYGPVESMTPVVLIAVTYLLGREAFEGLRRNGSRRSRNGGNGDDRTG